VVVAAAVVAGGCGGPTDRTPCEAIQDKLAQCKVTSAPGLSRCSPELLERKNAILAADCRTLTISDGRADWFGFDADGCSGVGEYHCGFRGWFCCGGPEGPAVTSPFLVTLNGRTRSRSVVTWDCTQAQIAMLQKATQDSITTLAEKADIISRLERGEASDEEGRTFALWFSQGRYTAQELVASPHFQTIRRTITDTLQGLLTGPAHRYYCAPPDAPTGGYVGAPAGSPATAVMLVEGYDPPTFTIFDALWLEGDSGQSMLLAELAEAVEHEATHAFAGTHDYGYIGPCEYEPPDMEPETWVRRLRCMATEKLVANADTYTNWLEEDLGWRAENRFDQPVDGVCPCVLEE
jgi:hypothetical protein